MSKFITDYGLIALLIVVAVGGYLLLGDEPEDVLAASLDSLGQRLTELVDDQADKEKTQNSFDAFKAAVASNDVAPEDVERVAANVLNLSASGAKLTPEDVDLVLDLAMNDEAIELPEPAGPSEDEPVATPATPATPPAPPRPASRWTEESARRVGSRVSNMVALADRVKEASKTDAEALDSHFQFVFNEGLKVRMDSFMTSVWSNPEVADVARQLEREKVVIWDKDMAAARRAMSEKLQAQRRMIERAKASSDSMPDQDMRRIRTIEHLNRLQELGVVLEADSSVIRMQLQRLLDETIREIERQIESSVGGSAVVVDENSG